MAEQSFTVQGVSETVSLNQASGCSDNSRHHDSELPAGGPGPTVHSEGHKSVDVGQPEALAAEQGGLLPDTVPLVSHGACVGGQMHNARV